MTKFLTEYDEVVEINADMIKQAIDLCVGEDDEFRVYSNNRTVHRESHERFKGGYVTVDASGILDAREIDDAEVVKLSNAWVGDMDCGTGNEQGVTAADEFLRVVARQVTEECRGSDVSDMPISILAPGGIVVASGMVGDFI